MHHHNRLIDVAIALAFTPACGADLASGASGLITTDGAQAQALEDEENNVEPAVAAKVQRTYTHLKRSGALAERNWRFNQQPPADKEYAKLFLEDDADKGISDGYAHYAVIPVRDQGQPDCFYLVREGGVGGWEFLAGPYKIEGRVQAQSVVLNERDAGRVVTVNAGDRLEVQLQSNPSTGYGWMAVTDGMGRAEQGFTPEQRNAPDSWGTSRFVWDTAGTLAPGETHTLHFMYRHAAGTQASRHVVITLNVQ